MISVGFGVTFDVGVGEGAKIWQGTPAQSFSFNGIIIYIYIINYINHLLPKDFLSKIWVFAFISRAKNWTIFLLSLSILYKEEIFIHILCDQKTMGSLFDLVMVICFLYCVWLQEFTKIMTQKREDLSFLHEADTHTIIDYGNFLATGMEAGISFFLVIYFISFSAIIMMRIIIIIIIITSPYFLLLILSWTNLI